MTGEIRTEPGWVDVVLLKFGKEQGVRNDVKTFAEVQEAEE